MGAELEKFITEQVEAGNSPTPQAAVEQIMHVQAEIALTDEDVEEINESEAEIDRGEFIEFDAFAAEMRKRYCGQ